MKENQPSHPLPETTAPRYQVERGRPHLLGAIPDEHGVNFSVFAHRATWVELLLFDEHDDPEPVLTIQLYPNKHKTFHFWHVYVRGLKPGIHYAYRVDGSEDLQDLHGRGDRYNRNKVLLDPYAKGNTNKLWNRIQACEPDDNLASSMRSVVIDTTGYDWEGDRPLNRPMHETIIYEMHVRGFTQSPIALSALARRLVNPRLVADPPPYRENAALRGPEHLLVSFDRLADPVTSVIHPSVRHA